MRARLHNRIEIGRVCCISATDCPVRTSIRAAAGKPSTEGSIRYERPAKASLSRLPVHWRPEGGNDVAALGPAVALRYLAAAIQGNSFFQPRASQRQIRYGFATFRARCAASRQHAQGNTGDSGRHPAVRGKACTRLLSQPDRQSSAQRRMVRGVFQNAPEVAVCGEVLPDIVLDDGSHQIDDVASSVRHLYPRLDRNGVYMVEDMHTAYWEKYGGGSRSEGTSSNSASNLSTSSAVYTCATPRSSQIRHYPRTL